MLLSATKHDEKELQVADERSDAICDGCLGPDRTKCAYEQSVKLSDYRPGERGAILQVCGRPDFRLRMMEMGFVKGAEIEVVKYAPLTDPIEFLIKGYHVSLRRREASEILMNKPNKVA